MTHLAQLTAVLPLLCWSAGAASWYGVLRDGAGHPIAQATVAIRQEPRLPLETATDAEGKFHFDDLADGRYSVTVRWMGRSAIVVTNISGVRFEASIELTDSNVLSLQAAEGGATGGEHLSSEKVAGYP